MPAYIPPALRGIAGQQTEGTPRLCERIWRVTLEYSSGGPFDVTECPENLSEAVESDGTADVTIRHFELPSEASTNELRELLKWFSKASAAVSEQHLHGDARCQLLFPSTLSKDARKHIHQLAQTLRLPTFSKGLGEDRRLMVHGMAFRDTPEMEAEVAAVTARRRAPAAIKDRARQIWKWCQADGGALEAFSLGELEELLLTVPDESSLPVAVKDLLERREHGTALINAIRANEAATALAVLEAHPRAAWIRDDGPTVAGAAPASGNGNAQNAGGTATAPGAAAGGGDPESGPGYYPLHLAALAGMGAVVERIASLPGAVEQRDRNYATPLKVAKKAGQMGMVELLLKHGAKDYEVNLAAHKTAPVGIPTAPPSASSSRRSHGGSPYVGSPATSSSPHTASSLGSSYMAAHAAGRQRRGSSDAGGGGGSRNPQQQHQQHGHQHGTHGPSVLGAGQHPQHRRSATGRRSLDEHHPPGSHQQHALQSATPVVAAVGTPANDPTANPFAVLAAEKSGSSSRRNSAGGLPPRPPANDGASDSDSSTGAAAAVTGYGSRSGRAKGAGINRCQLPPIQSGEVSEVSIVAALAALRNSASKPALPTAAEAPEEVGAAAAPIQSDDDDDEEGAAAGAAGGAAGDDAPKKRKTRRGRRGRGGRRHSGATADEPIGPAGAVATPIVSASPAAEAGGNGASAAGATDAAAPLQTLPQRAVGPASGGADSSDRSALTEGSESDGSAGDGSKIRRGGRPSRARRQERRRAAHVSGVDGGSGDRSAIGGGANGNASGGAVRRSSGAEYASFHQGHGGPNAVRGGGNGGTGGHYHVFGGHHGHADDAASWRRDPAAAAPPAGPATAAPSTAAKASASPSVVRGGPDEPRQPASAGGRPPAPRRMSAGPGVPTAACIAATAVTSSSSGGGAAPEAPGSPFHYGASHGPREHVAAGPTPGGVGFGFGRGRGRGAALSVPGAPGSGVPSAPGSPPSPPAPGSCCKTTSQVVGAPPVHQPPTATVVATATAAAAAATAAIAGGATCSRGGSH